MKEYRSEPASHSEADTARAQVAERLANAIVSPVE